MKDTYTDCDGFTLKLDNDTAYGENIARIKVDDGDDEVEFDLDCENAKALRNRLTEIIGDKPRPASVGEYTVSIKVKPTFDLTDLQAFVDQFDGRGCE